MELTMELTEEGVLSEVVTKSKKIHVLVKEKFHNATFKIENIWAFDIL